jgi:hypothetical protein
VPVAPNAATAVFATPQDQLFRGTRLAPHQKFAAPPHRTTRFSATPQYRNTDTPQHPALRSPAFPPHRNTDTPPVSALPPNRLSHRFPALRSIPRFSSESLVVADSPLIAATASSSPDTA